MSRETVHLLAGGVVLGLAGAILLVLAWGRF